MPAAMSSPEGRCAGGSARRAERPWTAARSSATTGRCPPKSRQTKRAGVDTVRSDPLPRRRLHPQGLPRHALRGSGRRGFRSPGIRSPMLVSGDRPDRRPGSIRHADLRISRNEFLRVASYTCGGVRSSLPLRAARSSTRVGVATLGAEATSTHLMLDDPVHRPVACRAQAASAETTTAAREPDRMTS